MKITFKGVPGEDHRSITMYGIVFPLGQAVEVDHARNAMAVRKLSNHPHFEAEGVEDARIVGHTRVDAGSVHAAKAAQALAESAIEMGAAGLIEQQARAGRVVEDGEPAVEAKRDDEAINRPHLPAEGSPGEREALLAYAETHGLKIDKRASLERLRSDVINAQAAAARSPP